MGREFELKYRASEDVLEAVEQKYTGWEIIQMETTYYDTPSHQLSRLRWTLRSRIENGHSICTLKTPLPDGSRGEWETECSQILEAIPRLIAAGAPGELASFSAEGIAAVCGARFTRRAAKLTIDGAVVELALDRGVLTGGGSELPLCEMEAELKEGDDAAALRFAQALASEFSLTPEPMSKFARAQALAQAAE